MDPTNAPPRAAQVRDHRGRQPRRVLHGAGGRPQERRRGGRHGPRRRPACTPRQQLQHDLRARPRDGGAPLRDAHGGDPARPRASAGIRFAARGRTSTPRQRASLSRATSATRSCPRSRRSPSTSRGRSRMLAGLSLNLAVLLGPGRRRGAAAPGRGAGAGPAAAPGAAARRRRQRPTCSLEDVHPRRAAALFPGQTMLESAAFRIARDAELDLDDEGGRDFLEAIEEELRKRRKSGVGAARGARQGSATRCSACWSERLEVGARRRLPRSAGPLDLRALLPLVELPAARGPARRRPCKPLAVARAARARGHLRRCSTSATCCCTTPTSPSIRWWPSCRGAADDPDVLAIKQTLYRDERRLARSCSALARAAEHGQAGHGPRGADGALRRAVEHPLGPQPGGVGRPRDLRHPRLQDPRQDLPGRAPRAAGHRALRPPRHRQLQRQDRAPLHRLRPHDRRPRRSARTPRPSSTPSPATPTRRA